MKLFKLLPIAIIVVFALSACNNAGTQQDGGDQNNQDQTQQQEQNQDQAMEGDQVQDQFQSRYGTNLDCGSLKLGKDKDQCEMMVNDFIGNMLEQEILLTFDISRCDELPADIAENCKNTITESGVKGPVGEEELMVLNEILSGQVTEPDEDANGGGEVIFDKSKCAELTTEGLAAFCEKEIAMRMEQNLFNEIVNSGESSRCNELTDENAITQCKQFFGLEVVEEPATTAEEMPVEPAEPVAAPEGATVTPTEEAPAGTMEAETAPVVEADVDMDVDADVAPAAPAGSEVGL